jgi:hypothetical protein
VFLVGAGETEIGKTETGDTRTGVTARRFSERIKLGETKKAQNDRGSG